jgi:HlyD family secretion protein
MAQVQFAATQAKDIQIGQTAQIDTHNGIADGKGSRIDPSVTYFSLFWRRLQG